MSTGVLSEMAEARVSATDEARGPKRVTKRPAAGGGSGDVVGPGSAVDNEICRFDTTTGKLIQGGAGVSVDDSGNLQIPNAAMLTVNPGGSATNVFDAQVKAAADAVMLASTWKGGRASGNGAAGLGIRHLVQLENAAGAFHDAAKVEHVWDDATDTSEDCRTDFSVMVAGSFVKQLTLDGSGATIITPTIASFVNAGHSHQNAAGGATLDAAAIAAGTFPTARIADKAITYAKIQDVSATDRLLGRSTSGAGVVEEIPLTAAGRALLDDASASAQRTTLGLGTIATEAEANYPLLAGRSGGQTLTGGTGSGDDLVLRSTSNVTRGDIWLENNKIRLGENTSGTVILTFDALSNDGIFSWEGSNDRFTFQDDVHLVSTKKLTFSSSATYIHLPAGGELKLHTSTVDIDLTANDIALTAATASASGRFIVGGTSPATSAVLELSSTTGALLTSRMTTTQRDALTAVNGMVVYNSTTDKLQKYEAGSWTDIGLLTGSGDVVGPGSATDNAICRYNLTTGKLIQDSGVLIDDSDNVTIPAGSDLTVDADTLFVDSTNDRVGVRTTSPSTHFHVVSEVSSSRGLKSGQYSTDTRTAVFYAEKARGTLASPLAVVDGDGIGGFFYRCYDGTSYSNPAAFFGTIDGAVSSGVVPAGISFETGTSTRTERMRITSGGRIGIGIVVPTSKLHVDQSSTSAAIPVLALDQADVSEEMIEFITTIGTGNAIEAVGAKSLTTTHFIKVTIPGGLTVYIPCGTIA